MKIIQLSAADTEKFGSKRVRKSDSKINARQLNLFTEGRMLKLHPLSPFEEAFMMDERDDREAARKLYHKAIRTDDRPADAYCNLGILESQDQQMTKAVDYLTLSLKLNPRHLEAHFNLANLYADSGNRKLAKFHYEICIRIEPAFSNSYFNLGLTLAAEQQYREAIDILSEYCRIAPCQEHKQALELIRKLQSMAAADKCG
ncbi:MAG: tetratricopeptide repeat protein [Balneolaceae bacterium]